MVGKHILVALVLVAGFQASAKTFYSVGGKIVSAGAAEEAKRKDPKTKVYKIQATEVQLNDETGNFKKLNDIEAETLKSLIK